jgi:hypothetical protein
MLVATDAIIAGERGHGWVAKLPVAAAVVFAGLVDRQIPLITAAIVVVVAWAKGLLRGKRLWRSLHRRAATTRRTSHLLEFPST